MRDMKAFIEGMPKAELHLHIEGSFEPELMFAIAARNGVALKYDSVEALRGAYAFTRLQDFLDIYYQGMSVLLRERDFYDLTWAYLERVAAQNVIHTEIFFDPQGHTARGVAFETALDGIWRALDDGARKLGITSRLIMCFLRHLDEADALETLDRAMAHRDRIAGVGLDSSELGHPPSKFTEAFRRAREAGFRLVAHAGEEGPAEYVREALDILHIERIDHGNRALDDEALVARIAAEGIALTVCPLSNLRLRVVEDLRRHPLREMLARGLKATVNSDDPAYFGGYMSENFLAVQEALDLTRDEIAALARNAFEASFADDARKAEMIAALDSYVRENA